MKFSKMLDEEVLPAKRNVYKKERTNQLTPGQISNMAKQLTNINVDNKVVFGYVTDNNVKCKYNKETMIFVRYQDDKILESAMITWGEFTSHKACEYFDEIN